MEAGPGVGPRAWLSYRVPFPPGGCPVPRAWASERADERGGADRAVRARVPSVPSRPPARFALRPSETRPQIRRGDPLNLSILVSGGKETNQDSLSNGE